MTHCNFPPDSSASEWMVPLVILYSEDLHRIADGIDSRWRDHASHAAVAETVRNLLGYQSPWGGSLLEGPIQNTRLHRGFYGPPRPLFGGYPFVVIDDSQRAFQISEK